ncbi:PD-(D/E)XK nuclease family protein [Dechloromonas sp.]|uniref:PD-(D/E)XK nuclease family protein n=1 Tax=Dechloromonas sp. TaxID=1917218 RepID=UPI00121D46DA|nr:PD-(D/E)XK nuclease family protein [Dechloromonas sp.]MBU3697192.1 PD-(D/E)XK nuclease family protein [Dechloromonas sp.]TEX48631.1 MAG: DNA helicase [Rhodocyclaceae bacterium]
MSDELILCATARLAQTLRQAPPSATVQVWRTPRALTPAQWLAGLADEARLTGIADLPPALDPFAEQLLWEQVIATSFDGAAALFDIRGMAASAAEAHALCQVWQLAPGGTMAAEECRRFAQWRQAFVQRCRQAHWRDVAGLHLAVIGLIEAGAFVLPTHVMLLGFDRPSPLEKRLAAALSTQGVATEFRTFFQVDRSSPLPAAVHACADVDAECAAAVAWVAQRLAADRDCRLAIVAPDLAAVRERLAYRLDDVLHPTLIRPDGAELPRCFNFSFGQPLAEQPLVRTALEALALGGGAKLEQARLSSLLLATGWSTDVSEADARARLDLALRRELPYFTSLPALIRLGQRHAEWAATGVAGAKADDCPVTLAALQALHETLSAAPRRQPPSGWVGVFRAALQGLGWPGERPLSSREFQARQAFAETLDAFAALDGLLGPVVQADAIRRLSQLTAQRIFQPETRGQPSVQILGVLEIAGLEFDGLWVMGMNDDQWPPAPRPNPLLPAELLRAAGAAHASADVELAFARAVQQRLRQNAPEQHFSYALADGSRLRRPSPLLADLPEASTARFDAPPTLTHVLANTLEGALHAIDDAQAPPVAAGERVAGGSWLLRAQAICPAWAFYQYRLGAEAMDAPVEGLDPAARGTLVHAALEAFWRTIGSSAALAALDDADQTAAIDTAIAAALSAFETERRSPLPVRFRQLEAARLQRLVARWLAVEAARALPFDVLACEAPAEVEIEGIRVRMVVDRIDRLADGRQVIIDYKTGASIDTRNWAEARITEPQLPIYAALVSEAVAAVVFAKVLLDKPAFAGVAEEKDILPGVQGLDEEKRKLFPVDRFPDWAAVVAHWREALHRVAGEVRDGEAGVRFADEGRLKYCDVLPLLRLPERRRLLAQTLMHGVET